MSRHQATAEIRRAVVTARVPPGSWMREEDWAQRLGLSRTPIREAFAELEGEGLLRREPRRGFQCTELSGSELGMLYPVIVAMEELAIRSRAFEPEGVAGILAESNVRLSDPAQGSLERVALDQAWHQALVSAGRNDAATEVHRRMSDRIARYEHAYWQTASRTDESFREHDRIVDALRDGDRDLACALVRSHWRSGLRRLTERFPLPSDGLPRPRT